MESLELLDSQDLLKLVRRYAVFSKFQSTAITGWSAG